MSLVICNISEYCSTKKNYTFQQNTHPIQYLKWSRTKREEKRKSAMGCFKGRDETMALSLYLQQTT